MMAMMMISNIPTFKTRSVHLVGPTAEKNRVKSGILSDKVGV